MRYDPERAPDPARWNALSEEERIEMVERYHRRARIRLPRLRVHAMFHAIIENQVAMGDEAPVAEAIPRLMKEGLSRHDAVHAVASVMANHLHRALATKEPVDNDAYFAEVRELTRERWYAEAGPE